VEQKSSRRPGRPPAFDRVRVIEAAVGAFWSAGYQRTSLTALEQATGVDRSTLYNSFGGKAGLYRQAAAGYVDVVEAQIFAPLHHGTGGVDDVVAFLDRLGAHVRAGRHPPGCLIVNDLASTGHDRTATERYLRRLDEGLRSALERSARLGETDDSAVGDRVRLLAAAVIGVNLAAAGAGHGDGAADTAADTAAALARTVRSWRREPSGEVGGSR
jgi:TetR/AcrR family transcriptional regulator, transcriptional repressor for nem operon